MILEDLIQESHNTAIEKGWWNIKPERTFGDCIALAHSELSEALEEYRNGHAFNEIYMADGPGSKPEGIAVEIADLFIRLFDTCARFGIPLETALSMKLAYNKTRPERHGGKII